MTNSPFQQLDDAALSSLADASRGLPFEQEVQREIDARASAAQQEIEGYLARVRDAGADLAQKVLTHQKDQDYAWFVIDQSAEEDTPHWMRVAQHGLAILVEEHHVRSYATLARLYLKGAGGYPQDCNLAYEWAERGARGGDPMAMYYLGQCYERGAGCEPDAFRALDWYEEARDYPSVEIMTARARLFFKGVGSRPLRQQLPKLHNSIKSYHAHVYRDGKPNPKVQYRRRVLETLNDYMRDFGHIDFPH
jgi:TPR repeat protein